MAASNGQNGIPAREAVSETAQKLKAAKLPTLYITVVKRPKATHFDISPAGAQLVPRRLAEIVAKRLQRGNPSNEYRICAVGSMEKV